ncbi:Cysteine-rich secretory protein, allergen V5/Tpx-1-related family and CAP domain-containing protein [Strongyloides ratti]|uniref:Cysteine-rich secretory protein, allergen V5/Tpx-1-related family and CAP domain-containing protein n=1 Tax=Strongyloides ratti TaxID=34506 RepID=A0A090N0G5_STRRB|nr:Cysteine-rich secretory protein, allergen V5/Tpx-1-related family and CAP domain-containing protein [Strongyloides ratti]CEF70648.1 Cysteine-rich secretory protein, allergen V5/Tpx-1-related family and CAP domain-containing protein [Strongyloides ratti]
MKFILIFIIFITTFISFTDTQIKKLSLLRRNTLNENLPKQKCLYDDSKRILYLIINNDIFFQFKGYVFKNYNDVTKYYNLINLKSRFQIKLKPTGGVKPSEIKLYSKRKHISEKDFYKFIEKNPLTNKIWKTIWFACNYVCFCRDNFKHLKKGIIKEINAYRKIHNSVPLIESVKLNELANIFIVKKSLMHFSYKNDILHTNVLYETVQKHKANYIIKNLFDEFMGFYNYKNNYFTDTFVLQTQMLWKKTTLIGLGVYESNNQLHLAFVFYPKGNINRKYKKNINFFN